MTAILLSDIKQSLVPDLEDRMISQVDGDNPRLGYIPSQTDESRTYFHPAWDQFKRIGFEDYVYVDVDREYDASLLPELRQCDAIFLSGGNTFHFLSCLKQTEMLVWLQAYVREGGVLIGASAGAMIMTQRIDIADIVDEKYKSQSPLSKSDYGSFGLASMHFYPHYERTKYEQEQLHSFIEGDLPVVTCEDGSGVVVKEEGWEFYGQAGIFK
ncbi:Type 1 glutamine amidotransferase-like domain-containing protein [Thalassobacillus sp. CUG 92003]|uniref:Type 1 glutamine amidotransferase-like domain-containing protein n=1 Tax=Thalassobacillus sp. CUG 92003 TaxID=2736641 RepID=UPI0015E6AC90|nr:Type 1 glutamine amidotransferase-like domain-containing protein [Thalassobacillus sp. CUG 92003]